MDYRFAELHERRFREVLGSGVYHSTELFCDYVPDKLCPQQGWRKARKLSLRDQVEGAGDFVYIFSIFIIKYLSHGFLQRDS